MDNYYYKYIKYKSKYNNLLNGGNKYNEWKLLPSREQGSHKKVYKNNNNILKILNFTKNEIKLHNAIKFIKEKLPNNYLSFDFPKLINYDKKDDDENNNFSETVYMQYIDAIFHSKIDAKEIKLNTFQNTKNISSFEEFPILSEELMHKYLKSISQMAAILDYFKIHCDEFEILINNKNEIYFIDFGHCETSNVNDKLKINPNVLNNPLFKKNYESYYNIIYNNYNEMYSMLLKIPDKYNLFLDNNTESFTKNINFEKNVNKKININEKIQKKLEMKRLSRLKRNNK